MATTLLIASLITSLVAGFATWRRDRIKDGNNVQVRNAIRFSAVLSLIVVALASAVGDLVFSCMLLAFFDPIGFSAHNGNGIRLKNV